MKQIAMLLFLAFCCTMVHSQTYLSDADFNYSPHAAYINDTFVKSFIGFNMKPEAGFNYYVKKVSLTEPIVINGVTYKGKSILETDKPIEFVSLDDIRKQYYPDVAGKVVYMINKYFVTKDVKSYKLDKAFIDRCEILQSSDFEVFDDNKEPFSIIRIFTKDDPKPILLR